MLKTIRAILFGIRSQDRTHLRLVTRARREIFPPEDLEVLGNAAKRHTAVRFLGLASGVLVATQCPAIVPAYPWLPNIVAGYYVYRCFFVPECFKFESVAKEVSLRHDLLHKPELQVQSLQQLREDLEAQKQQIAELQERLKDKK